MFINLLQIFNIIKAKFSGEFTVIVLNIKKLHVLKISFKIKKYCILWQNFILYVMFYLKKRKNNANYGVQDPVNIILSV
jgi:hypothetical protein